MGEKEYELKMSRQRLMRRTIRMDDFERLGLSVSSMDCTTHRHLELGHREGYTLYDGSTRNVRISYERTHNRFQVIVSGGVMAHTYYLNNPTLIVQLIARIDTLEYRSVVSIANAVRRTVEAFNSREDNGRGEASSINNITLYFS